MRVGIGVDLGDTGLRSNGQFALFGARLGEPADPNHNYHD